MNEEGKWLFAERAARQAAELHVKLQGLPDAIVLLESLGYTDELARENGFDGVFDLARRVLEPSEFYAKEYTSKSARRPRRPAGAAGRSLLPLAFAAVSVTLVGLNPGLLAALADRFGYSTSVVAAVLVSAGAVQYGLLSPLRRELRALASTSTVTEAAALDQLMRSRHRRTLLASVMVSLVVSCLLWASSLQTAPAQELPGNSLLLEAAPVVGLMLAILTSNFLFMVVSSRPGASLALYIASSSALLLAGSYLWGSGGGAYGALGYLLALLSAALYSQLAVSKLLPAAGSFYLSRNALAQK